MCISGCQKNQETQTEASFDGCVYFYEKDDLHYLAIEIYFPARYEIRKNNFTDISEMYYSFYPNESSPDKIVIAGELIDEGESLPRQCKSKNFTNLFLTVQNKQYSDLDKLISIIKDYEFEITFSDDYTEELIQGKHQLDYLGIIPFE